MKKILAIISLLIPNRVEYRPVTKFPKTYPIAGIPNSNPVDVGDNPYITVKTYGAPPKKEKKVPEPKVAASA